MPDATTTDPLPSHARDALELDAVVDRALRRAVYLERRATRRTMPLPVRQALALRGLTRDRPTAQ